MTWRSWASLIMPTTACTFGHWTDINRRTVRATGHSCPPNKQIRRPSSPSDVVHKLILRPGWYNSCTSWLSLFSRWNNAYLDLNIAATESLLTFRLYLSVPVGPMAQIALALIIVYFNWKTIALSQRSSKENTRELRTSLRRRSTANHKGRTQRIAIYYRL